MHKTKAKAKVIAVSRRIHKSSVDRIWMVEDNKPHIFYKAKYVNGEITCERLAYGHGVTNPCKRLCNIVAGGFIERRMASKQTYPCFACRRTGHAVMVFLDGKDDEGRTKYLNEDGTRHFHQGSSSSQTQQTTQPQPQSQSQSQQQQPKDEITPILKMINSKLDRLISALLLEKNGGHPFTPNTTK